MSWTATHLTDWTGNGGRAEADLGPLDPGGASQFRDDLSARGQATLELDVEHFVRCSRPIIVRVDFEDGDYREVRLDARTRDLLEQTFTIVGNPPIFELESADLAREALGGRQLFRFTVTDTLVNILNRFVFTTAAADGVGFFEMGVSEFPHPITITLDRATKAQVVQACLDALQSAELRVRPLPNGKQALDFLRDIGGDVPALPVRFGDRLLSHSIADDWSGLATVARVHGEQPTPESEAASIGENLWRVAARRDLGDGRWAIELREIDGTLSPVLQDAQFAGTSETSAAYLQFEDGTTRRVILTSRATSGEVDITAPPPLVGERVAIVATAEGDPIALLELPQAIAAARRAVGDFAVPGGRGERQYARNGGHEAGLDDWSPVNGGAELRAEIRRTRTGVTITGAANGARAAAVGTGTPFAIDGLIPGERIARGDQLQSAGAVLVVQAGVVPSTAGALAPTVAPGLPGNYADNTPFTLQRRDTRALTLDSEHSVFARFFTFTDSDTDALALSASSRSIAFPATPYSASSAQGVYPAVVDRFAGKLRLLSGATFAVAGATVTTVPVSAIGNFGTFARVFMSPTSLGGMTVNHRLLLNGSFLVSGLADSTGYIRYPFRVTAINADHVECAPDTGGLLPGETVSILVLNAALTVLASAQTIAAAASATLVDVRESRPLLLDGAHVTGAVALAFKNVAAIARRDWLGTDTLYLRRTVSGTFTWTARAVVTDYDEDGITPIGSHLELTLDVGASTLDAVAPGDITVNAIWTTGAVSYRLTAVTAGVASFTQVGEAFISGTVAATGSDSMTWVVVDPRPVTGAAAWAATARAIVPVVIPAGVTVERGQAVWANWIGGLTAANTNARALMRVHATVVGPAAALEIVGMDDYGAGWNGVTAEAVACYRAYQSSIFDVSGNTLFAAADTTANALGEASVVLSAANANAIADGTAVTIVRPRVLDTTERTTGSVMRLLYAVGGAGVPTSLTPGNEHLHAYVRVPAGSQRTFRAIAAFTLSLGAWTAGSGPVVALVDAMGTILASKALDDDLLIDAEPGQVRVSVSTTLTTSGVYAVRVYGGSNTDFTRHCHHRETMLYVGEAVDAPYTHGAHASTMQLAVGPAFLEGAAARITDRLTVEEISAQYAAVLGIPSISIADVFPRLVLGGRLWIEDADRTIRITALTRRPGRRVSDIEVGAVARDGSRLLGKLLLESGAYASIRSAR